MSVPFPIITSTRGRIAPVGALRPVRGRWVDDVVIDRVPVSFDLGPDESLARKLTVEVRGRILAGARPELIPPYLALAVPLLAELGWPGRRADGKATICDLMLTHQAADTPETEESRHHYRRETLNLAQLGYRHERGEPPAEDRRGARVSLRHYRDIIFEPCEVLGANRCAWFERAKLEGHEYKSTIYLRTARTTKATLNRCKAVVGRYELHHFRRAGLILPPFDELLHYCVEASQPPVPETPADELWDLIFADLAEAAAGRPIVDAQGRRIVLLSEPALVSLLLAFVLGLERGAQTAMDHSWLQPDYKVAIPPGFVRMPGMLDVAPALWARLAAQPGPKILGNSPDRACDEAVDFIRARWFTKCHETAPLLQRLVLLRHRMVRSKYEFWTANSMMGHVSPFSTDAYFDLPAFASHLTSRWADLASNLPERRAAAALTVA